MTKHRARTVHTLFRAFVIMLAIFAFNRNIFYFNFNFHSNSLLVHISFLHKPICKQVGHYYPNDSANDQPADESVMFFHVRSFYEVIFSILCLLLSPLQMWWVRHVLPIHILWYPCSNAPKRLLLRLKNASLPNS